MAVRSPELATAPRLALNFKQIASPQEGMAGFLGPRRRWRLFKIWAEEGRKHGGVIFVDERTISPADIGGLDRALTRLLKETGKWNWSDRVYCLRRHG
jgi:hypothetical protein